MISRYEVPAVSSIWEEKEKWNRFLQVEIALLKALEEKTMIPPGTARAFEGVQINPARIAEIEAVTRHDVVAFCSSITEQVPSEHARFFHYGVTSSDIIDTALSMQLRDSGALVVIALKKIVSVLSKKVDSTRTILSLGRSHGMAAEPMIFAQKFLSSLTEFSRRLEDYESALKTEITGQMSGAVGNYTLLTPEVERLALEHLNLRPEEVSSQVIPRDRIAKIVSIGALIGAAIERLSIEIRHLHRSEVGEVSEGFGKGQTGSSTMPHKKNPVAAENLCGIARILRSHGPIAIENSLLWHERDISHSSAERLFLPDHFGLLVYSLNRLASTLENLEIHTDVIEGRVKSSHRVFSSLILHRLISQNDCSREILYELVQKASFNSSSLEEMVEIIQSETKKLGLASELPEVTFGQLKKHYQHQFDQVRIRANEVRS